MLDEPKATCSEMLKMQEAKVAELEALLAERNARISELEELSP